MLRSHRVATFCLWANDTVKRRILPFKALELIQITLKISVNGLLIKRFGIYY